MPSARASTFITSTWEDLVDRSDFFGIVECTVAGGIVAKVKVIDSWKGLENGSEISMGFPTDVWEPPFPIALCGERYLVAALKNPDSVAKRKLTHHPEPFFYGMDPLWWRRIPCDFSTLRHQGSARIDGGEAFLDRFSWHGGSLEDFKRAALALVRLPPDQRELRVLKSQADKDLARKYYDRPADKEKAEELKNLRPKIDAATSVEEAVDALLAVAARDGPVVWTLERGGGAIALKVLEKRANAEPKDIGLSQVILSIRQRLGLVDGGRFTFPRENPTGIELEKMRALVKAQPERIGAPEMKALTVHDPAVVAEYLVRWVNPNKNRDDPNLSYAMGSFFAWCCGKDREENLRKLLDAKDPFIRVAGAIYLCFENRELGLQNLREFTRLEGDPGAWAALNLAQRGDKAAMPRALDVFASSGSYGMDGNSHRNLQQRLKVLLSNTAKHSGLPQPAEGLPGGNSLEEQYRLLHANYKAWWDRHADRATIHDPWLPLLEKQKVD